MSSSTSPPLSSYTTEGLLKRLQELQHELEEERGRHRAELQSGNASPMPVRSHLAQLASPEKKLSAGEHDSDAENQQLHQEVEKLRREKVMLENQLEQESEFLVNKMTKEKESVVLKMAKEKEKVVSELEKEKEKAVSELSKEKEKAVSELSKEKEQLVHDKEMLQRQLKRVTPEAASNLLHELSTEVLRLRALLIASGRAENESEIDKAAELDRLRQENRHLRRKVSELTNRVHELETQTVEYDRQAEIDDERMFNISRSSHHSGIATPPRTTTPHSFHGPSPGNREFALGSSPATSWWHSPQPHGRSFSFGSAAARPRSSSNTMTGEALPHVTSFPSTSSSSVSREVSIPVPPYTPLSPAGSAFPFASGAPLSKGLSHEASCSSLDSQTM